jgi:hypothetical protein
MKKILEEFGLDVSMLFRDAREHELKQLEEGWDKEQQMYDWEMPVKSSALYDPITCMLGCIWAVEHDHCQHMLAG